MYPPLKWTPWSKVRWGLLTAIFTALCLTAWSLHFANNDPGLSYRDAILILTGYAASFMLVLLWGFRKWL